MIDPALPDPVAPARWTAERYLHLVDDGVLGPDDRVELLEGVIAAANLSEYWIVNLRDGCVEVRRDPEPASRRYRSVAIRRRGDRIEPAAFPGASVLVDDLLPDGVG